MKPRRQNIQPRFQSALAFQRMGTGFVDGLQKTFNKIDSSYLYSFLALDVVALWIARVWIGWVRGRDDYDPITDEQNAGKGPAEVLLKTFWRDLKGLNHQNAFEELSREVLTAPGCLGAPTLLFALATFKSRGQAFWLGQKDFNGLKNAFIKHINDSGIDQTRPLSSVQSKTLVKDFVSQIFDDSALLKTKVTPSDKLVKKYGLNSKTTVPIGQFIEKWTDQWAEHALQSMDKSKRHGVDKILHELNDDLQEIIIHQYNRGQKAKDTLFESRKIKTRFFSALNKPEKHSLDAILSNLVNFKDYAVDTIQTHNKTTRSKLTEMAEFIARKVGRNKLLATVIGVGLGSLWLVLLPRLVQRGEHYPANRQDYASKPPKKAPHEHQTITEKSLPSSSDANRRQTYRPNPNIPPNPRRFYPASRQQAPNFYPGNAYYTASPFSQNYQRQLLPGFLYFQGITPPIGPPDSGGNPQ